MDRPWGESPWRERALPAAPLTPTWPEVAIVGGGLTGVSAAYQLARRGVRVALFEAGGFGDGASGRTGGLVLEGTAAGPLEQADDCVPALARLVDDLALDCDLRLPGCWEIAHRRSAPDEPLLPWHDSGAVVGVVRTVTGGVVNPAALLAGLARAATAAGARLYPHLPVKRLVMKPTPAIEVEGATLLPSFVIVALNAWTGSLLPQLRIGLRSALTFACTTAPLSPLRLAEIGLARGIPFYTVDTPYLWGRVLDDGRVMFGAGLIFGAAERLERTDVGEGDAAAILARLEARVKGLHPTLAATRITNRWAGPIGITDDLVPILGAMPGAPAVLVAGGYSGHGVAFSVTAGELMARAIHENAPLPAWGAPAK